MDFTFARHETFHIRTGWLKKALSALEENNHIFLEPEKAMDELGIGKNMINALRYWLMATKLTNEISEGNYKVQEISPLARTLLEYDEYFEDIATFWLIHFNLVQNRDQATTWYWFFNHFNYTEFNKEIFLKSLITYVKRMGEKAPALSSLENDFNVLRKMYVYELNDEINLEKNDYNPEEDLMVSPFVELKLLVENDSSKLKVNRPTPDTLSPKILYYCLLLSIEENQTSINVDDVLNKENSIGKIFKLNSNVLYQFLDKFQEMGYIRLDRHAGLNSISLIQKAKEEVLNSYYQN